MLGRFSTVLQNAVDALAPPAPLHEDFAYHWKKLMKHYLDVSTTKQVPIELTNIPAHFDQLLKILLKEDEDIGSLGHSGPCLEYLLQHNLLDLLVTLANTDEPPGMRQYVFQFVAKLLTQLKTPIAAHTSVFPPLQRLVGMCDGSSPTPTESDEVHFLLGLTALIRRNPQLIPVFTSHQSESSKSDNRRNSCSSDASSQFSIVTSASDAQTPPVNNPLFTPLATSGRSKSVRLVPVTPPKPEEGYDSGEDAKSSLGESVFDETFPLLDSLLSYLDTADSKIRVKVCQALMLLLSLPDDKLASTMALDSILCERFASRLSDLCVDIPEMTEPNHIDDMHVSWGLDVPTSPCVSCEGCRQVASFLSWFDFCDQVMIESHSIIADALGKSIRERFLEETLTVDSLSRVLTITLISKCFKTASSPKLNAVLCQWVVGLHREKDLIDSEECSVRCTLLDNWRSTNSELSLETLRLFEVLLEKGNEHVMHCLLYAYLNDRSYVEEEKEISENCGKNVSSVSVIDRIIHSFMNIVPLELRSTSEPNIGYEQYVSESHRQYSSVLALWQSSRQFIVCDHPSNNTAKVFNEGPFLRTLFESIKNIPNQEYEINLELTAVVSRLALSPHPWVNEFILDTTAPIRPEITTLYSSLCHVATVLSDAVVCKPDYKQLLAKTRARLLGVHLSPESQNEWSSAFECIVVVEELCKELAAIAYVKHKQTS